MSDDEIIDAALRHYHHFLSDAAGAMAQKTFRFQSGRGPTAGEVSKVLDGAKRTAEILKMRALANGDKQ